MTLNDLRRRVYSTVNNYLGQMQTRALLRYVPLSFYIKLTSQDIGEYLLTAAKSLKIDFRKPDLNIMLGIKAKLVIFEVNKLKFLINDLDLFRIRM